ncbi:single-stranded DNA-binding protein [Rodentibacter trehalosifermentans]|uniref:Single-stranded DNA-binding protein n=1 Tax=Rodentibacter trehalosifermentans TaxID=1908263 RepID=A0A1V3IX39_9PAST|nr:single-stranded DNA-binding protein [Rodentibacter trehalosifermentans]OOF46526.1 single-stranded DNA-binding protein [Rodentibacter trehalosifermentans]
MAYSLNQVTLLGNVGSDPEIKQFSDGSLVAKLTLATTHSYKPKDSDEWVETVDWHTIQAYGSQAKTIASYVRKGHKLEIVGQLKNNNYTDDKSVKHYGYYVRVEKLILLEKLSGKLAELPIKEIQDSKPAEAEDNDGNDLPF